MQLRKDITKFLRIKIHKGPVDFEIVESTNYKKYKRQLIKYLGNEHDPILAYLYTPNTKKVKGKILVHHQHNSERHLGKSEVSGLVGDPNQFFCEALVNAGFITLAPDSIAFEDRRTNRQGIRPAKDEDDDVLQHYNQMCYRLLKGKTLMKKVIEDSSIAISLLDNIKYSKTKKIGILGHSYGGNTVVFHSALDTRIEYSCTSGAVCSYKNKFENQTGIEMAMAIPGFLKKYEIQDLINCICPRKLLILTASEDIFAMDAISIYKIARKKYKKAGKQNRIQLNAYQGGHALTPPRFDDIIGWFIKQAKI